jgi:hypothetical protein
MTVNLRNKRHDSEHGDNGQPQEQQAQDSEVQHRPWYTFAATTLHGFGMTSITSTCASLA